MKATLVIALTSALLVGSLALAACNNSGISAKPRGAFTDLACLDVNGDARINTDDATDVSKVPDFNADGRRTDDDAAFVRGVDIPLAPGHTACGDDSNKSEFLVTHEFLRDADVNCGSPEDTAVLVLGVGGGVDDLKDKGDAAGVRSIMNAIIKEYEDNDVQTMGIVAGSAFDGAQNPNTAMEDWLTNVARVQLDRFSCLRLVTVGFSHGAVSVEVVGSRIEQQYGPRMTATVVVDRISDLYIGNTTEYPTTSPVFNVYQTNSGVLGGAPLDRPNVENWDASGEQGPEDGDKGGDLVPVSHVTIDNSRSVRDRIVAEVVARSDLH
jgi:hypothetical protein